jgi:septal ring factor EnvC (AmiA/AmiB activator)
MEKRMDEIQKQVDNLEGRINLIEKNAAVSNEQIKMIFNILNEIKSSIKQIADKMDESSKRPSQLLWAVAGTILGALLIAGLKFIN